MFGGFGGEDVDNEGAGGESAGISGGDSPNSGGYYSHQEGGQDDFSSSNGTSSVDPAAKDYEEAQLHASQTLSTQGTSTAADINSNKLGGGGGQMIGAIYSLFDPKARRLAKRQRSMARTQGRLAIANAQRAIEQFQMDSQRQEQNLQQSYAARGIGDSSIKNEGMEYYARMVALKNQSLSDNLNLARVGMTVINSQIAASYAQPYLQLVSGAINTFASMA